MRGSSTTTKNTTARGELSELEIATALSRAGKSLLRPPSSGLRYDLAVDNGDGTIMRIQCKTGILRDGFVEFRASNADARRPNGVSIPRTNRGLRGLLPAEPKGLSHPHGSDDRQRISGPAADVAGEKWPDAWHSQR
jgi:PD-(D/E)XK endonuclease